MSRRCVWGGALLLTWSAVACEPDVTGPVRVLPPDGASTSLTAHAQVVASRASLTEDLPTGGDQAERVAVGITIVNLGEVPVEDMFARDGRVDWLGMGMAAAFASDPASDTSALAPGEQRELLFAANVVPLGVCTNEARALPNPHHGMVSVALTLLSSAGAWSLAGIDAAVTCTTDGDRGPDPPRPPTGDVEF